MKAQLQSYSNNLLCFIVLLLMLPLTAGVCASCGYICRSEPCQNTPWCTDLYDEDTYVCQCLWGWVGRNCDRANPCLKNPCPPDRSLNDRFTNNCIPNNWPKVYAGEEFEYGYSCHCKRGYMGQYCQDVDPDHTDPDHTTPSNASESNLDAPLITMWMLVLLVLFFII